MRKIKRILNLVLVATMLLVVLSVNAFAIKSKFADVNEKDQVLSQAVALLDGIGVAKGVSDTSYSPNSEVTRQQMAAFVYRLMKEGKSLEEGENTTSFTDLYDETFNGMISWAASKEIIKGISETEFNPDGGIILQDAYVMLVRALGYEKEAQLTYPIGYIDVAESEGINLGKGLPSNVTYTTPLTRGNIAIILYNAFYANMAEKQVVEVERLIGQGDNAKYVIDKVEENIKLCEKIFGVEEQNFVVRETSRYAFNDSKLSETYKPTRDSNGEGTMLLMPVEDGKMVDGFYTTATELGLDGSSDGYIMSVITVYYKYDDNKNQIDKIFYAQNLMDKQSANALSYGSVEKTSLANDPENRYTATSTSSQRMDGSVTVAGKKFYFFDAPYTYLEPSYNGCENEADRYAVRNADNSLFIDLKCLDVDEALYSWYITDDRFASKDGYSTEYDAALAKKLNTARTSGIYSVDIFDPDGDGRYEYVWYKPASFGQMIMDKDYTFYEDGMDNTYKPADAHANDPKAKPQIYANGATLSGAAFNNEDFVIAYVNQDANMIHIHGIATGMEGTIVNYRAATGTVNFGTYNLRTCYQYRHVENFYQKDNGTPSVAASDTSMFQFFNSLDCVGAKVRMYTYTHGGTNNIMYYEILSGSDTTYSGEDLLIPLEEETVIERNQNYEAVQYLKVLINGEEKYIEVDVEKSFPNPRPTVNNTYKFDNTIEDQNGQKYNVYLGKLCTYTVDKNGVYTLKSLLHSQDKDGNINHVPLVFEADKFFDEEKSTMVANDLGVYDADDAVQLKKISSKRYEILDAAGNGMLGTFGETAVEGHWFKEAYVDEETVFMIKSTETVGGKQVTKLLTYTGENFPGTVDGLLSNVQYVYRNYGDSEKAAELVLFYGEADGDLKFEETINDVDYRIVQYAKPVKVADDEYRYSYTLLNPASGEVEEGVLGLIEDTTAASLIESEPMPAGAIAYLTTKGNVNDYQEVSMIIDPVSNENLAFITDVDIGEKVIELVPVNSGADDEYFTIGETLYTVYTVAEDAVISVIKYSDKTDIETAEMSPLSLEKLAKLGKDLKAYNAKVTDENGKISTAYANYVKAYITYSKTSRDKYPIIDSIIVVVNPDEAEEYLDI